MPRQTTRPSSKSPYSRHHRPNTRVSAQAARHQTHRSYLSRQSVFPRPSRIMANIPDPRDRMIEMFCMFEPNGQLPEEFRSWIYSDYINSTLSEQDNLRGRYYSILVRIIIDHVLENLSIYQRMDTALPQPICRLAVVEKQIRRDARQDQRQQQARQRSQMEQRLMQRLRDAQEIIAENNGNALVISYSIGVLLLVIDSIELDSSTYRPVDERTELLQAAVRQLVTLPEDMLRAHLTSIQETYSKLETAALQLGSAAAGEQVNRLEGLIRRLEGRRR